MAEVNGWLRAYHPLISFGNLVSLATTIAVITIYVGGIKSLALQNARDISRVEIEVDKDIARLDEELGRLRDLPEKVARTEAELQARQRYIDQLGELRLDFERRLSVLEKSRP